MSVKMLPSNHYEDDEDEELNEDQNIRWSNLLFLPFNPTFKAIVLVVVIIKTVLGPIQAVYPIVYCWDTLDYDTSLILLKSAYLYLCDPIYSIDTLLHILHRQITEEALRREYLPKSGFLILLDIISLIPFFSLLRDVPCAGIQFSPNIYAFTEIVIIYRIADYFSILSSHKPWQIIVGYTIVFIVAINGLTCFFLLLTFLGFCKKCDVGIYDWRKFVYPKLKETDIAYSMYVYAYSYILTFFMNDQIDDTKPSTVKEYIFTNLLMIVGYIFITFVIIPKMVAESMLKFRRMGSFYRKVQKIIEETRRRNISPKAHIDVKQFYCLMWKKRSGITSTPEVISEIPRYLRLEIRQDLVWPVFYHSPTFRKTSSPYKRWLCETIRMDFKLPGEKFFAGPNCNTHLYYIKSGKLQLISSDDGVTPLITLTSGTLIGDISFYVPPQKRKVIAQCITYCEVLYITRVDILNSLHKHPVDRKLILSQAMERIRHAKTLYTCKQHVRGLDRSEDEGLAWNEPYDIFWKLHGEVAEKIIKESCAFAFADHSLIRELAYKAKFLMLPKNCTLSVFGVHTKTLTWVVQGYILSEYHDLHGDLHQRTYNPGEFVSTCAVFLGKPSLRTVYAYTECEVLYVKVRDFFNILKHFPNEVIHFEMCLEKFGPTYDKMLGDHIKKFKHDRKRSRFSVSSVKRPHGIQQKSKSRLKLYNFSHWWFDPSSRFIQIWMIFRVMIAILAIVVTSLQGGSGACIRKPLKTIGDVCDFIGYVDIFIKCLLAYYDGRGLLITDLSKRLKHYISRGFILDVIGCVPLHPLINIILSRQIDGNEEALINTTAKFALMYLILGYFNYLADLPHRNNALYMILKLQVMTILVLLGTSHYFVSRCISFNWDSEGNLQNMTSRKHCWLPRYLKLDEHPTIHQLHVVYAESFNLAQSGLMRFNVGKFRIEREYLGMGIVLCVLGVMFWYVMCYSLTLLVLNFRGNTIFQHAVSQLRRFLQAERVEKKIIDGAIAHFRYWWFRTKGINIQNLMNERIGVVFRQDLAYYFFKNTIETADTLLRGGENLQRQIVSVAVQWYFLPDQTIIREMDLSPWVYIIHRGSIIIKQDNQFLAKLSQGSIFGQLDGNKPRPVRITAVSDGYADLLQIPIKDFQEIIEDETREIIFNNPESKFDYLAAKKTVVDTPYNTIPYILRGRKTIKLPWMKESFRARTSSWYARWLCFCWLFLPLASAFIVLLANAMPEVEGYIYWMLFVLDVLFALYLVSEFYTLELQIENDRCVERIIKFRMFKKWGYYVDILSLILPIFTHVTGNWNYRFARLLRLRLFYYFHLHFCKGFKSQVAPAVLKFVIVFLTIHGMTCGWISVACHHKKFPLELEEVPRHVNRTIDYVEWANPRDRQGGCARMTKDYFVNGTWIFSFIVPRNWTSDYIVAMTYILVLYTHTEIDVVVAITLEEIYYKVFINLIIYPFEIWILSIAISATYTKFRELYTYDYDVESLVLYLEHTGLCPVLLDALKNYTKQLWERQRGNWLPELAQQAPQCLREDMLSALYMHHLEMPTLFRELPEYFKRQLVTKLQRVVIFPGKFIVQEGDIFSCMYFIHEGEVEKWYTDKSGEKKMLSLLTTNGYFGLIPGLFPNTPYQFSYYSRTVVDFVFLRFHDWQELLHGYPKIKYDLYTGAKLLKKELQKNFMF
ncbi:unnamed protein product [Colias eurytheme]|nr:unnamed protein product [Colias eurytheme]